MERLIQKAEVLMEALPYIRGFFGKSIVVKYGGSVFRDEGLKHELAKDLVLMKYIGMNPVLVHGGGPEIDKLLDRLGRKAQFVEGMRVTDAETMEVVEMVLVGKINKEIVSLINHHGGKAVGLCGKDADLIRARKLEGVQDVGQVGEVIGINTRVIEILDQDRFIPVIAPVGVGEAGESYNINADVAAGKLAAALGAEKLVYLTDVDGILDEAGRLVSTLSCAQAEELIQQGVIIRGMLPKVRACLAALRAGVPKAHIINGRVPHALLLELFTDKGIGTQIVAH